MITADDYMQLLTMIVFMALFAYLVDRIIIFLPGFIKSVVRRSK